MKAGVSSHMLDDVVSLVFRVNMAASMASQAAARGLRTATSKHILLDKVKVPLELTWL